VKYGFRDAVSLQGAVDYLTNLQLGRNHDLNLGFTFSDLRLRSLNYFTRFFENEELISEIYELRYELTLNFGQSQNGNIAAIKCDKLTALCRAIQLPQLPEEDDDLNLIGLGKVVVTKHNEQILYDFDLPPDAPVGRTNILTPPSDTPPDEVILENPLLKLLFDLGRLLQHITIYDIDPKLPKRAIFVSGHSTPEPDGSNLAIVLKKILEDRWPRMAFSELIRVLLPFVDDFSVEQVIDKTLLFKVKESYTRQQFLPASVLSDGAINMIALIIVFYFEEKPIILIEEPERNMT
jgi:hypothetical protein